MIRSDRRTLLALAMGSALAPGLLARAAGATAPLAAGTLIAPPDGPLRYRREVERSLIGGGRLLVAREFEVRFERFADGFMVHGHQVGVTVEAPPYLAALARLEEEREEQGLFPLSLDPFGRITSGEAKHLRQAKVTQAFREAQRMLASQGAGAGGYLEMAAFVGAMEQASAVIMAEMPEDLFAPAGPERSEDVPMALPTGDAGQIVSRFAGERDAATGLMRRARREVLTRVQDTTRLSVERWRLGAA